MAARAGVNGEAPEKPHRFGLILAAAAAAGFLLTNMPQFLIGAALFAAALLIGGDGAKHPPARLAAPALATAFCFLMPPLTIGSGAQWKYPIHKTILGLYKNVQPSGLFPDFSGDVLSDYRFSYLPSIMQGTGHFSVRFAAPQARIDEYVQIFSAAEQGTFALSALGGGDTYPIGENAAYSVWYDRAFFADCPDAEVIVCETGTNPNHPHSTALIFDRGTGKVQFSRLG